MLTALLVLGVVVMVALLALVGGADSRDADDWIRHDDDDGWAGRPLLGGR